MNLLKNFWETKTKNDSSGSNQPNSVIYEAAENVEIIPENIPKLPERGSVGFCEKTQQFVVIEKNDVKAEEPAFVEGRIYSGVSSSSNVASTKANDRIDKAKATFLHAENNRKGSDTETTTTSDSKEFNNNNSIQMGKKHKKLPVMQAC